MCKPLTLDISRLVLRLSNTLVLDGSTLTGITRGIDNTVISTHAGGELVHKYEVDGVSLLRINKTHELSDYDGTDLSPWIPTTSVLIWHNPFQVIQFLLIEIPETQVDSQHFTSIVIKQPVELMLRVHTTSHSHR